MMFSYLTVHFWKCTSRTILNSQNKSEKKKKVGFFPTVAASGIYFFFTVWISASP